MRALYEFIVSTDNRYNNKKDIDGKELIINTEITERDAQFVNRVADVLAIPAAITTPIKVGDQIIVHHNVFRTWYNQRGELSDGSGFLGDGQFSVHIDQIFAYKKDKEWISAPGFLFVSPIKDEGDPTNILVDVLGERPLTGLIAINNPLQDVCVGDTVGFTPDSEYEFQIDEKKLYRIRECDLTIVY